MATTTLQYTMNDFRSLSNPGEETAAAGVNDTETFSGDVKLYFSI
jgi:hypothetical protein